VHTYAAGGQEGLRGTLTFRGPHFLFSALPADNHSIHVEARKQVIGVVVGELGWIGCHRSRRRGIVTGVDPSETFGPFEATLNQTLFLGTPAAHGIS
jgi:hypothetical protein